MMLLGVARRRALWGLIPALLRTRFGVSEILTSLMLVYVAQLTLDYLDARPVARSEGHEFPAIGHLRSRGDAADLGQGNRPQARLASLCAQAEDAVRSGYSIVTISDRLIDKDRVAIPALLALSAIHQHLVTKGLRTSTGLVVETGSAREVHHFALLGGYGAEAVHPYLALETLLAANESDSPAGSKAIKNYVKDLREVRAALQQWPLRGAVAHGAAHHPAARAPGREATTEARPVQAAGPRRGGAPREPHGGQRRGA